jgi:hypothetical protein
LSKQNLTNLRIHKLSQNQYNSLGSNIEQDSIYLTPLDQRTDWAQTDSAADDFIKNKPDLDKAYDLANNVTIATFDMTEASYTVNLNLPGLYRVDWGDGNTTVKGVNCFWGDDNITVIDAQDSFSHSYNIGRKYTCRLYGITSIGRQAFIYCAPYLTDIVVGNGVTAIEGEAFGASVPYEGNFYCTRLKTVVIPDSVEEIGEGAFQGCTGIEEMTLPFVGNSRAATGLNAVFGQIFGYERSTTYNENHDPTMAPNNTAIYTAYQYKSGTSYYYYYIPNSLKKVTISAKPGTMLYENAFKNCRKITDIILNTGVATIGNSSFSNCTALKNITMSDDLISIGNYAFSSCSNLTSVTIPDSVTSIGKDAFRDCTSLADAKLSSSLDALSNSIFWGCSKLSQITIPNSVESIDTYAFYSCSRLTSITIPDSVTTINMAVFSGCTNLTKVIIGKGIELINNMAFKDCSSLNTVIIHAITAPVLGSGFSSTGEIKTIFPDTISKIIVPGESLSSYKSNDTWVLYTDKLDCYAIEKPEKLQFNYNTYYKNMQDIFDNIFDIFVNNDNVIDVLPDSGSDTLYLANVYSQIETKIGFSNGSMKSACSVRICDATTNQVTKVAANAFDTYSEEGNPDYGDWDDSSSGGGDWVANKLDKITAIIVPKSVKTLGSGAFSNCSGLKSVILLGNITEIPDNLFYNCTNLTTLVIPASVTKIEWQGNGGYYGSNLKTIYYQGTSSDWAKIEGSSGIPDGITVHCCD